MNFQSARPAGGALKLRLVLSNPLATSQTLNLPRPSLLTTHQKAGETPMTRWVQSTNNRRVSLRVGPPKGPRPPLNPPPTMAQFPAVNGAAACPLGFPPPKRKFADCRSFPPM